MKEPNINTEEDFKRITVSNSFSPFWQELKSFVSIEDSDTLIKRVKEIEKNNLHNQELLIVFSLMDFKPLYFSKSIQQISDYEPEELLKFKTFLFFKVAGIRNIDFPFKAALWAKDFQKTRKEKKCNTGVRSDYYFGLKMKKKTGEKVITSLRMKILHGKNDELPSNVVIVLSDITHLFKGDFYCARFSVDIPGSDEKLTKFYRSSGVFKKTKDLVTKRELEILLKSKKGLNNKEIGQALFISTTTVEQHKKNMLKKTGAKDITSLIHLCSMCEVL